MDLSRLNYRGEGGTDDIHLEATGGLPKHQGHLVINDRSADR